MKIFSDLTETERKTLTAWGLGGLIVFIIVILLSFIVIKDKANGNGANKTPDEGYTKVYDQSRFYTVTSALDKFYSFINEENKDALMKVLDANYITKAKVTEDNVLDFVKNSESYLTFEPGIMCKKDNGKGTVNYLLKVKEKLYFTGSPDGEEVYTDPTLTYEYYRVTLDGNSGTFSVTPITEKEYGGSCHE